ncbi:MAG: undecaprenyl diphosphate synthase family protein, partial [Gemmatimonadales bacterium]
GSRLHLRIALDYSARDAILRAAQCLRPGAVLSRESFTRLLAIVDHGTPVPELDLLIRTGGERRLSDFLLWEAAYAELVFSDRMWPDFTAEDLASAVREFSSRERRFGGLPDAVAG